MSAESAQGQPSVAGEGVTPTGGSGGTAKLRLGGPLLASDPDSADIWGDGPGLPAADYLSERPPHHDR